MGQNQNHPYFCMGKENEIMNLRKLFYTLFCYRDQSNELRYLKELEKSQFLLSQEILDMKFQKLKKMLDFAYHNIKYYKQQFDIVGFNPDSFASIEDLRNVPILTRTNLQENLNDLLVTYVDKKKLIRDQTGGSTAAPVSFYYDKDCLAWRNASEIRHNKWAGFDIGMKCAGIWGARRDFYGKISLKTRVRRFLTSNFIILDASSITEEIFEEFTEKMSHFKPSFILAYAGALTYYAKFLQEKKIVPFSPKAIITSAEFLADSDRSLIENVFGTKVYNRYGSREFSIIASECEKNTMHINDECLHLEFIREDGSYCKWGEEGDILITQLQNYSMPLIRYRIGDRGTPLKNGCLCGRNLSSMKMTSGRITDFILTPVGRMVSGAAITAYVIAGIEGLGRVQIYQKEIDKILVKVEKNVLFNRESLIQLEQKLRNFLDNTTPVFEIVDRLTVPESGKLQFCVNELLRKKDA